jgi:hypothetical protein
MQGSDPGRWVRIKALFAAALERPPADRDALLETECGDDGELRHELDQLLQAAELDDGFIETPAVERLGRAGEREPPPR